MTAKVLVPPHMFACLDAAGENYDVEIDLPGVNKKDIDLRMHEGIIHVLAEREDIRRDSPYHECIGEGRTNKPRSNNGNLRQIDHYKAWRPIVSLRLIPI